MIKRDQDKEDPSDHSVLSATNPDMPRPLSRAENYYIGFFFLLYPCFPLKDFFLNSRLECPVSQPPFLALLSPGSYSKFVVSTGSPPI